MSTTTLRAPVRSGTAAVLHDRRSEPAYHAYRLLRVGFVVLPILFGID